MNLNTKSFWIETAVKKNYPKLSENLETDIIIIGAGITGIISAYLLNQTGQKVTIIDMAKIASGATGFTTAKITTLQGIVFEKLVKMFNKETVADYANANQEGINLIERIAQDENINCQFERTDSYTYTELDEGIKEIEDEYKALIEIGQKANLVKESPLPFEIKRAIKLPNQAQFHPGKFLFSLAETLSKNGVSIFESTKAAEIKDNKNGVTVKTESGKINAKKVILASHFPFHDKNQFFSKLFPHFAYALAARVNDQVPDGMYYTEDNLKYAVRNQTYQNEKILIFSGITHKTGQGGNTIERYRDLESYVRKRFNVKSIDYYWSTEDYDTPDGLPYIGKSPGSENIFLATGFGGWGMAKGAVSATLITDLIKGKENPYGKIFSPERSVLKSGKNYILENLSAVAAFTKSRFKKEPKKTIAEIKNNDGEVINLDGEKTAIYKNKEGTIKKISPVCTHMGCGVNWNNAEKTWDCVCHGSRFDKNGKVIHGPALKDLPKK